MTKDFDFLFELKNSANIQWRTSDCGKDSILFYWIPKVTTDSIALFKERLASSEFKYCIVNTSQGLNIPNVIELKNDEYKSLQVSLLKSFYPIGREIRSLGVTGTNGKTTTVDLIRQLALQNKKQVMTFGTLGVYKDEEIIENFNLTTPSIVDIYKTIFTHQQNIDLVVFELSSHALHQDRLGGIEFDAIGWSNFSQDHLDYHKSMDEYFESKKLIFKKIRPSGKVFLTDDLSQYFEKINTKFEVSKSCTISNNPFFKIKFNQTNLGLAISILSSLSSDFSFDVNLIVPPAGRFEIYEHAKSFVIIDYAHTPDALTAICSEVAQTFKEHKLITLFGCGGDRDRSKRPLMGQAASKWSQSIVITNDNPRTEDPEAIALEVAKGVSVPYVIELDRKKAIAVAMGKLEKHVLIIAGKGHENYMEIEVRKTFFSDRDT